MNREIFNSYIVEVLSQNGVIDLEEWFSRYCVHCEEVGLKHCVDGEPKEDYCRLALSLSDEI